MDVTGKDNICCPAVLSCVSYLIDFACISHKLKFSSIKVLHKGELSELWLSYENHQHYDLRNTDFTSKILDGHRQRSSREAMEDSNSVSEKL